MTAQCEGMGEVGSARYELALLPPCPSIRALCYSNCQRVHDKVPYYRHIWLFKKADFNQFRQALRHADFMSVFELIDLDDVCRAWSDKFLEIAKEHVPNKKILVRPNDSPWYTSHLRLMKRNVQRLFHKFKKVKSTANWESYKKLRNDYQQAQDQAENDYKNSLTDSLADNKNSKVWWRTVTSLLGKGSFRSLPIMKDNNKNLIGSKEKADAFNNFFLSHSNIDTSNAQLPPEENCEAKLVSVKASEQEVLDLLMSLDTSKATGPDGNRDLEKVKDWANQWLVNFSIEKTKLMTCSFRSINHPDIVFDGMALPKTSTHKHLGLTFNSDFSWSSHIKSILDSVSPMADVLKKLKYKVDKESLEKIYVRFIRPKLEYGSFIWDNCQIGEKEELEKFQMSIARTVTGARKGTSHDLIVNELNWPSLADRKEGAKLKNFIKIINKESPL